MVSATTLHKIRTGEEEERQRLEQEKAAEKLKALEAKQKTSNWENSPKALREKRLKEKETNSALQEVSPTQTHPFDLSTLATMARFRTRNGRTEGRRKASSVRTRCKTEIA